VSEHRVQVSWERGGIDFAYEKYPRDHVWSFEGGVRVPASAAPAFRGNPERVDPEAAFVAALSSCHMLTFLAIASRKRLVVDRYEDEAVGSLAKNDSGKLSMTQVVLRPRVVFAGTPPAPDVVADLHARAHDECFIANSVLTRVEVQPGSSG
jgi:organic hydroperoxide reductase OsmC/OhrA